MKGLGFCLLGASALLCGCEAKIGEGEGNEASNVLASAEGKAEEGKIALSAPGFDVKLSIPLDRARTDNDDKILYPESKITGLYISAHPDGKAGSGGEVEMRFASSDPPDKVAAWYRDPARSREFALSSDRRDGQAFVMAGTRKGDDDGFRLRLEPRDSGTDGRLVLRDNK